MKFFKQKFELFLYLYYLCGSILNGLPKTLSFRKLLKTFPCKIQLLAIQSMCYRYELLYRKKLHTANSQAFAKGFQTFYTINMYSNIQLVTISKKKQLHKQMGSHSGLFRQIHCVMETESCSKNQPYASLLCHLCL